MPAIHSRRSASALFVAPILVAAHLLAQRSEPGVLRLAEISGPRSNRPGVNAAAKRENAVSIVTDREFRVIKSNGWPDHAPGEFPCRGNPNIAAPQEYTFRIPLKPVAAAAPQRRGGWFFAVALNGVPFEAGTAETWNNDRTSGWRYEAHTGFLDLGLDEHNAHVQPTGAYHYHASPVGLVQKLGGDDGKMLQVAWAADGFAMFTANCHGDSQEAQSEIRTMKSSFRLRSGPRPAQAGGPGGKYDGRFTEDWEFAAGSGDLDQCNGHPTATPGHPEGIYHYHITNTFPFLPRAWHGRPDESFAKGAPGGGFGPVRGPRGPGGFPLPLLMRTLDANGDGIIDTDEIANAPAALRKLDKNHDGRLTPDEYREPGAPPPR